MQATIRQSVREELGETSRLLLRRKGRDVSFNESREKQAAAAKAGRFWIEPYSHYIQCHTVIYIIYIL